MILMPLLALSLSLTAAWPALADDEQPANVKPRVLLIGKPPDHPYGSHMYLHTCRLLGECARLNGLEPVVSEGWPAAAAQLKNVQTIVVYTSPGAEYLLDSPHRDEMIRAMNRGTGLVTIHWASSIKKENLDRLGDRWISFLGGTWVSNVGLSTDMSELKQLLPEHPICRGWKNYELYDEYYLNPTISKDAQPLLQVTTKGQEVTVGWAYERPDGGRSYGTTLGHYYTNFERESFRKTILNAILWTAKVEVPSAGARVDVGDEFLKLPPEAPPPYDLVLRNGKIVDGTGNPWFYGDVAIQGDRLVAVGRVPPFEARRQIDLKGLVVAPGFIDMHSHSDFLLLEDGNAQSKVRQGVTTEVLGEGSSAGPSKTPHAAQVNGATVQWTTLGGYFDTLERAGVAVNVVSYVGLDTVWEGVMGKSFTRPMPAQLEQMQALIDEAMRDGAFGLSSQLAMPAGSLATTDDIVTLCQPVARHHGIFSSHIRNEGTGVFKAVAEAIAVGERAKIPVDIIHLKIADQKYWGRMNEVVGLIEAARQRGVNVQANVYPYTRGNNNLSSIIPPWAHEGGISQMLQRLQDPTQRERMKKEIREVIPGWYNHYTAVGGDWSRMLVNGKGTYEGLTMDRVMAVKSKGKEPAPDPLDILFDMLIEERGSVLTVYAHHDEKDMNLALAQPWCSIGSDGLAHAIDGPLRRGVPHPRSFGTFPRVLGVYVRELGLLRLEDAVRKMTSLNATKLGILDRGLLRVGNFADVVVFDPERIIDRSTYEEPFQYSEGIVHLVVNGRLVLQQGEHTGARPGRAIRHGK